MNFQKHPSGSRKSEVSFCGTDSRGPLQQPPLLPTVESQLEEVDMANVDPSCACVWPSG